MDFNKDGMPVGNFWHNHLQKQMPKTIENCFEPTTALECNMCGELFPVEHDEDLQDHLDDVHSEDKRW